MVSMDLTALAFEQAPSGKLSRPTSSLAGKHKEIQGSDKHIFTYGAKAMSLPGHRPAAESHFDKKNFRLPLPQEKQQFCGAILLLQPCRSRKNQNLNTLLFT